MKTVGKRINRAFTVAQPLPVWPVAGTGETSRSVPNDIQSAAPRLAAAPEMIAPITQPRCYATALPSRPHFSLSYAPDEPCPPMTDAQHFEAFLHNYQNLVFSTAMRLLANQSEAEDITQEVFLRAYERFAQLQDSPTAGGWLKTVATNLSLNHPLPLSLALDVLFGTIPRRRQR